MWTAWGIELPPIFLQWIYKNEMMVIKYTFEPVMAEEAQ
jgi:hypothetical protein